MTADAWQDVKQLHAGNRLTLGPRASFEMLHQPDHVAMVLARYRAAAALIGTAGRVLEIGCGEGFGTGILARGRHWYVGIDPDEAALEGVYERTEAVIDTMVEPCAFEFQPFSEVQREWVGKFDAAVSLDVIEHVPYEEEEAFMENLCRGLHRDGVCVIGTPNQTAEHLASEASRVGHVNLYTADRLLALMRQFFRVVQSFGMADTGLHLGHPEMRHYLIMCGIGPR